MSLGVTWNINNPYSGRLADGFTPGSFSPLINPVIRF
jgi:hypothetical protein